MSLATLHAALRALRRLTATEARQRYAVVFGRSTRSRNGAWLRSALARRLAEEHADALADATPRQRRNLERAIAALDRPPPPRALPPRDPRLPAPGTVLRRRHQGREVEVRVLARGFEALGHCYASASALARAVTGQRWNGLLWLGLRRRQRGRKERS